MQPIKLIVARHGNTFNKGDVILRVGAKTNLPLTEQGHEQGRKLGAKLNELKLYPTQFFTAPLRRTVETSLEIASAFEVEPTPQIADFLLELDYGEDDGRPETEVVRRLGAAEAQASGQNATPDQLEELGKAALKRWDAEKRLPAAWQFLQERVDRLEDDWRNFGRMLTENYPRQTIVATTSNGIARFSLALLPDDAERPTELKLATGAFALYVYERGEWRLEAWNVRP